MKTTQTRTKVLTAAVGAVIASAAASAVLFLGAGTAQAVIPYLPTPRDCGSCDGFNPQPDKPDYPDLHPPLTHDPGSTAGIFVDYWGAP
jgi:hypothetical protein